MADSPKTPSPNPQSIGSSAPQWLGALTAVVLIAIAWSPLFAPNDYGQRALQNKIQEIENLALGLWNEELVRPWDVESPLDVPMQFEIRPEHWLAAQPTSDTKEFHPVDLYTGAHPSIVQLVREADAAELEKQDYLAAIDQIQQALVVQADYEIKAALRLRLLQLNLKAGRADEARAIWNDHCMEWTGSEVQGSTSIVLLAFLAVRDSLGDDLPAAVNHLIARFADGGIVTASETVRIQFGIPNPPSMEPALALFDFDLNTKLWVESLLASEGEADGISPDQWMQIPPPSLRIAVFQHLWIHSIRNLISDWDLPASFPSKQLFAFDGGILIVQQNPQSEEIRVEVHSQQYFAAKLEKHWRSLDLLSDEFQMTLAQTTSGIALPKSPFILGIRHPAPDDFVRSASRPIRLLRTAVTTLGLLCAVAGIVISRALQRQQKLQRLKTDFIANVSHELRTPVSSILLMTENLESGLVTDEAAQKKYHGFIRREANRLRRLVDDALDFSRLERGLEPEFRMQAVELERWRVDLEEELGQWAVQNRAEVEVTGDFGESMATMDADAMRRAVLNLADNSLRHSGSNRVQLSCAVVNSNVQLTLRDFGEGLPEDALQSVFKPFQQLKSTSIKGKGAGLGLAIVAKILDQHGGTATAANAKDGGALFTLSFPLPPQS